MPQVESVRDLVDAFGGLSETSRALGHRHPTTVQRWLESGRLPHWRIPEVLAAAEAKNIPVTREKLEQLATRPH